MKLDDWLVPVTTDPGLYVITNTITGDFYVGTSVNMRKRVNSHKHALRNGSHHSGKLQAAWDEFGEAAFKFTSIARIADKNLRLAAEQSYITYLRPKYNVSPTASSSAGVKRSPESVAKLIKANNDPIKLEKIRKMASLPKSAEHREKIALAHIGMKPTEETKAKLRASSARRWARERESKQLVS